MSIKIGERFVVLPSSEAVNPGERIPVILGPGRAFGSGEHETTSSCLEELEKIPLFPGAKVLDLGCGTGIFAIAAAKMGAHSVIALDPDADAIETTVNNIKLNGVEKMIFSLLGELRMVKDKHFDLIMANLYGDILLTLVRDIPPLLEPGGYLLLSGIAFEYSYELKTGFAKAGFKLLKNRFLEEYCTMVYRKEENKC